MLSGKKMALLTISGLLFIGGLADSASVVQPGGQTALGHWTGPALNVMIAASTFLWYREDAEEYGFQRSRWWDWGILLSTALFVLPWYLARTRGRQGWLKSFAWLLLFLIVGALVPYVAGLAVPYVVSMVAGRGVSHGV